MLSDREWGHGTPHFMFFLMHALYTYLIDKSGFLGSLVGVSAQLRPGSVTWEPGVLGLCDRELQKIDTDLSSG